MTAATAHNITEFGLRDMAECGKALREIGEQENDLESFARRAAAYLNENLVDGEGEPACALVRFFIQQNVGCEPGVSQLFQQLGLINEGVLHLSDNVGTNENPQNYDVLFVPEAKGELLLPSRCGLAVPTVIRSILGLGCRLPSGDLFTIMLFVRVGIARYTAELFKAVALHLRLAILHLDRNAVLTSGGAR